MSGPPVPSESSDDTNVGRESPPAAPRWVKVFGIIALVLLVLFVARHLTSGGFRGHTMP
jgi:hypothetical protein